jgi:Tfp pilus assembly protein PilN
MGKVLNDEDRQRRKRIAPLATVGCVLHELAVVYRGFVRKEITATEAQTRRALLSEIRTTIEGADVAQRLEQVERLVEAYRATLASQSYARAPHLIATDIGEVN